MNNVAVYRALIEYNDSNFPIITVNENTTGGNVIINEVEAGIIDFIIENAPQDYRKIFIPNRRCILPDGVPNFTSTSTIYNNIVRWQVDTEVGYETLNYGSLSIEFYIYP